MPDNIHAARMAEGASPRLVENQAESITYTPEGGSPSTISAIVDREGKDASESTLNSSRTDSMEIQVLGSLGAAMGDEFTIDAAVWSVIDPIADGGTGLARLTIRRFVSAEKEF